MLRAPHALVRTGAVVCAFSAALMAAAGVVARDRSRLVRAAVPSMVGLVLVGMLILARYPVVPLAFVTGGLIVGSHWLYGSKIAQVPAMVGIIVVGAVLAVLVERERRWRYLAPWAAGVGIVPFLWYGFRSETVILSGLGLSSFLLAAALAVTVRNVLVLSDRRYRNLLTAVPVAVFEQDWREAGSELTPLRSKGVTDLRTHLITHPDLVRRILDLVSVVDANPAAVEIFDACDFEQVAGFMGSARVTDDNLSDDVAQLVAMAEGAPSFRGVCRTTTFGGQELWLDVHWAATSKAGDSGTDTIVVAATDVTGLKMSERSKDELIESLSHEFRTPLTAVLGFARLLSDDSPLLNEGDRAEMLESIVREGADLANVVDDLLTNARRHGGNDIAVEFRQIGSTASVVVFDDGPGVPQGVEERVFEPHQRGDGRTGLAPSLGLGLAISRHLARLMAGDVIYRREGDRTVFELSLPAFTAPSMGASRLGTGVRYR